MKRKQNFEGNNLIFHLEGRPQPLSIYNVNELQFYNILCVEINRSTIIFFSTLSHESQKSILMSRLNYSSLLTLALENIASLTRNKHLKTLFIAFCN